MEAVFKMPYGNYKGTLITSKDISLKYLRELEETLLLKGVNTSDELMRALDREIKRRESKSRKT